MEHGAKRSWTLRILGDTLSSLARIPERLVVGRRESTVRGPVPKILQVPSHPSWRLWRLLGYPMHAQHIRLPLERLQNQAQMAGVLEFQIELQRRRTIAVPMPLRTR